MAESTAGVKLVPPSPPLPYPRLPSHPQTQHRHSGRQHSTVTLRTPHHTVRHPLMPRHAIQSGIPTQFASAMGAGFFMATTVSPFDMVRTRLMNQPPDAKIYSGAFDCFSKIMAAEGPGGFYRGFFPIWMRFAPTTCLQVSCHAEVHTSPLSGNSR